MYGQEETQHIGPIVGTKTSKRVNIDLEKKLNLRNNFTISEIFTANGEF